jgi:putative acetyltransferase
MNIRYEQARDIEQIFQVNLKAFDTATEANLVNALRKADIELISLVAEVNDDIVGHILFSPVTLANHTAIKIAGLAPMAVLPAWQNKGIGTQLVNEGLKACIDADYDAVVVLGHPNYYPRFGFTAAINYGISTEYDVPTEVFMLLELKQGALDNITGTIKYHSIFNET